MEAALEPNHRATPSGASARHALAQALHTGVSVVAAVEVTNVARELQATVIFETAMVGVIGVPVKVGEVITPSAVGVVPAGYAEYLVACTKVGKPKIQTIATALEAVWSIVRVRQSFDARVVTTVRIVAPCFEHVPSVWLDIAHAWKTYGQVEPVVAGRSGFPYIA